MLLNSAAAIHIARGISMEEAMEEARKTIDGGRALAQLESLIRLSNLGE